MGAAGWGRPPAKPGEELIGTIRTVMPGYFQSMAIPIRKGRDFNDADNSLAAPHRFIVNETFVRRYLSGEEPIGKSINALMQEKGVDFRAAKLETGYGKVHDYGIGAQILKDLGVKKIRLLSNHPPKVSALDAFDLEIVETISL